MKILRNGKRHDALKLDHRLLYYNMAHVVGSVDLDAMVLAIPTLAELTGIQDDPSKRLNAALFLARGLYLLSCP